MTDNSAALRRARAADSQARLARCESVLRAMVAAGGPVTVAEVTRRARVGEKSPSATRCSWPRSTRPSERSSEGPPRLDAALAVERDFWKQRASAVQRRLDEAVKRIAELEGQRVAEERGLVAPQDETQALRATVVQLEANIHTLEARATHGERDVEAVRKLNLDLVRENTRLREAASGTAR
ncbi:MAG: hypothetical protein M3144_00135 [Actinomycetota bacterium]|nr:hypothetical protein [Actinomycetota bacterium]